MAATMRLIKTASFASAVAVGAALDAEGQMSVTPIAKVITLMQDMLAKGKAEKDSESVRYAAFSQWCSDQGRVRSSEVERATAELERLSACIEMSESTIRSTSARIAELDEDIGRWEKDSASASDIRKKESVDFKALVADYTESIDALKGAIQVLKSQSYSRAQAEDALVQVTKRPLVPEKAKAALAAFLQRVGHAKQQPDDMLFRDPPKAYGYEFQSGGVVDMLEKLSDEFNQKKDELVLEERNAQHNYELMLQQLKDSTENAKHEISQKVQLRAQTEHAKAEAEAGLSATQKDKAEDEAYLKDVTSLCQKKAVDFESRQKLRAEEITSLTKAIEIISGHVVAGAGEAHLPAMLQRSKLGTSFAQLRSHGGQTPAQFRAARFLAERAAQLSNSAGSAMLEMASRQLESGPFDKVKKLISDLISKLMEEGTSETEHKGWCDAELATSKVTREARSADVESLSTETEVLTSDIARLTQEVSDLSDAIAQLDAAMATQLSERAASKAANDQTVKEAKEAQTAVQEAITVLKEYYAKSFGAFIQQAPADASEEPATTSAAQDAPETFNESYKGMFPEGGTVVDFLEVVLSDFSRLEAETLQIESSEVEEHKKFMFEAEKDKALKQNDVEHKERTRTDKESALHSAETELKQAQEQLDKANVYYEKLKPTCVDSGVTYEERRKNREAEIQSLEEALKILMGQDLPTMS